MDLDTPNTYYHLDNPTDQSQQDSSEFVFSNGATFSPSGIRGYSNIQGHQTINSSEQTLRSQESNAQCQHPEYSSIETRLSSFQGWPTQTIQTPLALAEAGFYYNGVEDQVSCFTCGGGLGRWDPEDDPWTEHIRWYPHCQFVKQMRGEEFIALVQASVEYTRGESTSAINDHSSSSQDISTALQQMSLSDPEFHAALQGHKDVCLGMGFQLSDVNDAVEELIKMGNVKPTLEDVLDMVDVRKERQQIENVQDIIENESPMEENQRLKSLINCIKCGQNNVNALFIPCTHHRMCMDCAECLTQCPVCNRHIRKVVRTYLA